MSSKQVIANRPYSVEIRMNDLDYSIFYKDKYYSEDEFVRSNKWDLYISAFNDTERVQNVFSIAPAEEKHWLVFPEYGYSEQEHPQNGFVYFKNICSEDEFIIPYIEGNLTNICDINVCIDITGFVRPYLVFLFRYLLTLGVDKVDIIYTEPNIYVDKEETKFTGDTVECVRQVRGCEGIHSTDMSNDLIIIGSGYDHKLISFVSDFKDRATKVQMFGFPSLQADMYQENLLRALKAEESLGRKKFHTNYFAPANDPFITANVLKEIVELENKKQAITNLYLSPLLTKAQTLGFILFFIWECIGKPVSIVLPFCVRHSRGSSIGMSRIWKYRFEFPRGKSGLLPSD